ncbi:MAG: hypothetical protein AB8F78_13305, partial [Saprospiraceae bacterium]
MVVSTISITTFNAQTTFPGNTQISCDDSTDPINTGEPDFGLTCPAIVWLNEIDYEPGIDMFEFAGPVGLNLAEYNLHFYNAQGLETQIFSLGTLTLNASGVISTGFSNLLGSGTNSIALAVHHNPTGIVTDFTGLGISITAQNGPAVGMTSSNTGIVDDGNPDTSIQLVGTGNKPGDFTWSGPGPSSLGSPNAAQTITSPPMETPTFSFSDNAAAGSCISEQIITRTFTANDACGNVLTGSQTITVVDDEAPLVACAEFGITFNACPDPIFPNTPNGIWNPVPATGSFFTAVGGFFLTTVDLSGCVVDNCSDFGDMEWELVNSFEENRVPGCSVDIINEIGIRDGCENEATTTIIVRNTFLFNGPPPVIVAPADVTVECGDPTDPTATGIATATSGCGTPTITFDDVSSANCGTTETITRTWTATDACGNTGSGSIHTATQIITIEDNTAPVFDLACQFDSEFFTEDGNVCPADATISLSVGEELDVFTGWTVGGLSIASLQGCVSDNCTAESDLTITVDDIMVVDNGTCNRTITITFIATDECDNDSQPFVCNYNFTDNTAPVVACTEFTETFNRCPDAVFPNTPSGNWQPVPANGMLLTAVGGSSVATLDLTTCITDNCSAVGDLEVRLTRSFEENRVPGCSVDILNEYEVRDACENLALNVFLYRGTLQFDGPPPVIVAPADVTVECGNPTDPTATGIATATSTCGTPTITFIDITVPGCGLTETITRVWIANDACGNTGGSNQTATQIITVEDNTPPTVACTEFSETFNRCPDSVFPNTPSGNWQPVPANGILQTAVGGSSIATLDLSCISDICGAIGDLEVRLTRSFEENRVPGCSVDILNEYEVRDACGNVSPDLFLFRGMIQFDGPPPVLVVPANATLECGTARDTTTISAATATSGCGSPTLTFVEVITPGCGFSESITRTWTATDGCGQMTTASQMIDVVDTTPPTVTCTEFSETFNRCPDAVFPNTPSGNFQNVPASGILQTAVGGTSVASIDLSCITDNCSLVGDLEVRLTRSFEENRVPGCSVDILNEYEVRDACGNLSPDLFLFRGRLRFDGPPPVIVAPADVTVECGDPTDPAATGIATATAGCGTPMVTFSDSSIPGCGITETITRTWTATDACGNTDSGSIQTAIQTITVEDNTAPVFDLACQIDVVLTTEDGNVCPADATISLTEGEELDVLTGWTVGGANILSLQGCVSDNCTAEGDLTITVDDITVVDIGSCNRTITITFIATDECGNDSQPFVCNYTFIDDTAPVVACTEFSETFNRCPDPLGPNTPSGNWISIPSSGIVQTAVGGSSIASLDFNCVTDNCGLIGDLEYMITRSFEENRVPGCSVDILNEFAVRDACGNVSPDLILFRGMIRFDGPPPVLIAPIAFPLECGIAPLPATTGMATATSGCGTPTVTFSDQSAPGPCGLAEIITRTWLATDGCGKTSDATQLIIITDNTPPTITTAPDVTVDCDDDTTPTGTGTPTATDACSAGPPTITFADDVRPGSCPGNYVIRRTWTATDECANSDSYLQIITVQDIEGPVFAEAPGALDADLTNVELDAFGSGLCLTTLDVSGLETAINAALSAGAMGVTGISFPTPTDACSDPITTTATATVTPGAATCLAMIDILYTSTDACMNSSEYAQQLTITDTAPPVLSVPAADVTVECDMPTTVAATGSPVFVDECIGSVVMI